MLCKTLNEDLYIYRYANGVKLVKQDVSEEGKTPYFYNTGHTIEEAFQLPINMAFLNAEAEVQKINVTSAETLGFSSTQSALGKTLFDIARRESAQQAIHNDKVVMQSEKLMIFEELIECKNALNIHRLQITLPWYNSDNKVIGVFGCNTVFGQQPIAESLTYFMRLGLLSPMYETENNHFNLSKRETEIVRHTVRGKSAKVIAAILNISYRTVEQHLENIKIKMGVLSKTALIEKAIDCGFNFNCFKKEY